MPQLRARHASRINGLTRSASHYGLHTHEAQQPNYQLRGLHHLDMQHASITKEENYEFKNAVWSQINLITNYKDASALPHKVMHLLPSTVNQKNRNPTIQSKTSRQQMHARPCHDNCSGKRLSTPPQGADRRTKQQLHLVRHHSPPGPGISLQSRR